MRRPLFIALATAALLGMAPWLPAPAQAAEPQILGLVASNGPMPMSCGDRDCTIDLSAFCMQERAPVPPPRTPYQVAEGRSDAIAIVARSAGGRTVRVPAMRIAEFHSARGNRAVRMSVARQTITSLGLTEIAVEVGPMASLVPQSLSLSDDPIVRSEIALVTGPLREVANRLVDQGGPGTVAALITNRLINAIPEGEGGDVDDRGQLWTRIVGEGDAVWTDREGLEMAEDAYRRCAGLPGGGFISFRQCLAARHDIFLSPQNRAYWEAVEGGS